MLALVLDPDPRIVRDHPAPVLAPGSSEAVVRVVRAGVCDTDLQLARGYMGFTGVPGHEMVGVVEACADATWIGKRVVADINAGCGTCAECVARGGHHCRARTVLGIVGRAGAFAEKLAIPVSCLVEVPPDVSDDAAVFAEPLAAALHVLDDLEGRAPHRAIVLGDGKLGLLIARALAGAGVKTAIVGRHAKKLALATGAETFLEADVPPSLAGADLVVEATGSEAGLARALELVAPRGTVVLKTTVAAKLTVDLAPVVIHEVRVVGSRCGDMKRAVDALARGAVDPLPLVEARYPLARADEALAHAGRRGTLKVLIDV
ncbi:MAG: alcohol dehydrogenase catalytic domain-containing protein [Labilithrix sp.]|nr:alcohol dehydrogenase catalytic domain-containing protein [Labilithrix sp.]MCW5810217.1 alcohol dehydrogenase catalytic domain-containing protein [Labilithrix sp.]